MQFPLILFSFLILISLSFQAPDNDCNTIITASKEKCNNISPETAQCCFVESPSSSICLEYNPDLINYDSYVEDHLKDTKIDTIISFIQQYSDFNTLETNEIIDELKNMLPESIKIDCNTFTKEINYSKIEYTEDDIAKAKQDNFCGKLMSSFEDINETQCLNGVVFTDLEANGEKCCYSESYSVENDIYFSQCLSLSQAQRDNEKYLESLIYEIERPFTAKIICDGFTFEKSYHSSSPSFEEPLCYLDYEPTSKEQCTKIDITNSECCYIKESYGSEGNSFCEEYSKDEINYESYADDILKNEKIKQITNNLNAYIFANLTNSQIIEELNKGNNRKQTIECKSFEKTIDYSKIKYIDENIETAKKSNFCGRLIYGKEEPSEELCSNGIVFADLAANGEKCCYAEVYSEETRFKNAKCLSLSKAQREDDKYLKTFLPTDNIYFPTSAKFVCNGFNKQYSYINNDWIEQTQEDFCRIVKYPSKETCNNVKISNSECCYEETILSSGNSKKCEVYNPQLPNINGYDQVLLNKFKLDLILENIPEKEKITDYDTFISKLKAKIPKKQSINCNTASKSIDYKTITITQEDIINAQKSNFCSKFGKNVNEDTCFNGALFPDFKSAGGQCCYLEISIQGKNEKNKKCIPLSKIERENNELIKDLIKENDSIGQYTATISCDGFNEVYDSSSGEWSIISDSSLSSYISSSDFLTGSIEDLASEIPSDSNTDSGLGPSPNSFPGKGSFIKIDIFNLSLLFMLALLI